MTPTLRTALFAAVLALTAAPAVADDSPPIPTLSLSATGSVPAPPDTAIVNLGVLTEAETAGPALTESNQRMRKLITELKAAGVEDRDIATSSFRIDPVMVYPPGREDGTQQPPRITGYRVDNALTVRVRDIGRAGELLDAVVRVGANQIQGIAFTIEDDRALLDRARTEAMRAAEAKAKVYAKAGNFGLRRILRVSEAVAMPFDGPVMTMKSSAEAVPLAPGEQELSVTVQIDWEIEQQR